MFELPSREPLQPGTARDSRSAGVSALAEGAVRLYRVVRARARGSETLWEALAGVVTLLVASTAIGMLAYGDSVYAGPSYEALRRMPGGMRTYGAGLLALAGILIYGFGQQQLGQRRLLRIGLALTAAWYMAWLVALAATYVLEGHLWSWSALTANAAIAAVANLVARHVPPDRRR
ncbi:hypothetical protein [Actinoplanes sp. NBRC 101535]|uniref:hypothetical protein n=1 Tax=Actinoplanes sp. NBRC 101535 TaxID=3032196 RepID=UPI0024A45F36|nr:hypothetical protein [Actinoplanes sp. NBRC 101535]GLY08209.1 hypothetical protein Acsp01_85880 [Actinoplanes sp. NBRC 101535]